MNINSVPILYILAIAAVQNNSDSICYIKNVYFLNQK